jgi:hypothetical protein
MPKLEEVPLEVWCDACTCVHDMTEDPYRYGYKESGERPECTWRDWRKLWAGAPIRKKDVPPGEICSDRHLKDCELGDNWKQCRPCVECFNSTCRQHEKLPVPDGVEIE